MTYDERDMNHRQGGVSIMVALTLAVLMGLGGFVLGYYVRDKTEPDPREVLRTLEESGDSTNQTLTPAIDTANRTSPSRIKRVNMDSVRTERERLR